MHANFTQIGRYLTEDASYLPRPTPINLNGLELSPIGFDSTPSGEAVMKAGPSTYSVVVTIGSALEAAHVGAAVDVVVVAIVVVVGASVVVVTVSATVSFPAVTNDTNKIVSAGEAGDNVVCAGCGSAGALVDVETGSTGASGGGGGGARVVVVVVVVGATADIPIIGDDNVAGLFRVVVGYAEAPLYDTLGASADVPADATDTADLLVFSRCPYWPVTRLT